MYHLSVRKEKEEQTRLVGRIPQRILHIQGNQKSTPEHPDPEYKHDQVRQREIVVLEYLEINHRMFYRQFCVQE